MGCYCQYMLTLASMSELEVVNFQMLQVTLHLMKRAEGRPGVGEADKQQIRRNLVPVIIR